MAKPTVPIYDQDGIGRLWIRKDIYTGPDGTGQYVPNVDDIVIDYTVGWLRCVYVDVSTSLSTLEPWTPPTNATGSLDVLLGTIPGYASESSRVYYDKSVTPHTLRIDRRLRCYGSAATHVKIFKGVDISAATGKVIGFTVNPQGQLDSANIPLELVGTDTVDNLSIKTPTLAYTQEDLEDGDVVTVVVYDGDTGASAYQKMLVKATSFVMDSEADIQYITGISMDSPFMDPSAENQLNIPMNTPVESLSLIGEVTNNSGRVRQQVINGSKMALHGFENFAATIVGQKIPLVLTYHLDSTEQTSLGQNNTAGDRHISVLYSAVVTAVDGAATVKLFVVPTWVDGTNGYRLEYWLYSLDRKTYYYVTPYVTLGATSADFQPLLYGSRQQLTVVIDLNRVDTRFRAIRHAQTLEITLVGPGTDVSDPWYIRYSPGQDPAYGKGISAKFRFGSVDDWGVRVDCGATTQTQWLEAVYFRTQPLYYPDTETQGLTPTHFVVVIASDVQVEFPISQWNEELSVASGGTEGEGIHLRWIYRSDSGNDLYLGASPMVIRHVTDYTEGTSINA